VVTACVPFLMSCTRNLQTGAERNRSTFDVPSARGHLDPASARLRLLSRITIGVSEGKITDTLKGTFSIVQTNRSVERYPFTGWLPCTNKDLVAEWIGRTPDRGGGVEIVFGVFLDAKRNYLVDALSFRDGHIEPLVNGIYNKKLSSLRRGDSIQQVYKDLGKRDCEYFQDAAGKWRVRFLYLGLGGRAIVIEADAADGRVLRVDDETI